MWRRLMVHRGCLAPLRAGFSERWLSSGLCVRDGAVQAAAEGSEAASDTPAPTPAATATATATATPAATARTQAPLPKFIRGFEEPAQRAQRLKTDGDFSAEALERIFSLESASRAEQTRARVAQAVERFARHEGDTGSPEVQIAVMTVKIDQLTEHIQQHRKDLHSKRGLLQMAQDRRKMLQYLKRKSFHRYNTLLQELGIRGAAGMR